MTITLQDEIDIVRGDVLAKPTERPELADQFAAHLIWMDQDPLVPARKYVVRIGTQTIASASVTAIKYRIDVNTREHLAATTPSLNEIAFCNFATRLPLIPMRPTAGPAPSSSSTATPTGPWAPA